MSIPKKIHYVWVGGQPKSKDIQACMKTWRKHLGDYEIIEWNEKNFDIDSSLFVRQAYEQKDGLTSAIISGPMLFIITAESTWIRMYWF